MMNNDDQEKTRRKNMSHINKKKKEIQKKRGATFVGLRPQFFAHKDDKESIRRAGKKAARDYMRGIDRA